MPAKFLLSTSVLFFAAALSAQDCNIPFTVPLFGVQAEPDLWYGNATRFNGATDSLRLNLFKPVGDGQLERPLVIAIHGGGFSAGNRNELNDYCSTLASMGWNCATISYRLGFYGTGLVEPPYAYDPNEVRRAVYRTMQDTKGAIRFLKGRQLEDSTSTTNVLLLGFSAGSFGAMHAAYLDRPEEKPASANAIGQVQHFLNFYPRPDLGPVEGTLNLGNHDADVLGVVNIFGALLDTSYIEGPDDPALYSYHQTQDPVVGCGFQRPYWGIGLGVPDNYPFVHGSCSIDNHVQGLGFAPGRYLFNLHNGNDHDIHDPVAVLLETLQWMRDLFCSNTTAVEDVQPATIRIHPNPSAGLIMVDMAGNGPTVLEVRDALGRMVHAGVLQNDGQPLDMGHLPNGMYLLRTMVEGREVVARFVVER
jgi:alpha/beta superfamily hydrolase